jgi:hypothetical protein
MEGYRNNEEANKEVFFMIDGPPPSLPLSPPLPSPLLQA